jgi:hypothetical protein
MEPTYQVFNPLTGQHTKCPSENSAKEIVADISLQVIKAYPSTTVIEILHENGDVTWEAVDFVSQVKVTL